MPANPKAQLTKLTLGIAGVAAVATVAGRFAATNVNAATTADAAAPDAAQTEPQTQQIAPQQGFFAWLGGDHDDDDEEYEEHHEEGEHHGRERGRMQFAQPGTGSTTIAPSTGTGTQQPVPRSRTRKS